MKARPPYLHIFCEGVIDQLFIAHFIEKYYSLQKNEKNSEKNQIVYDSDSFKKIILEQAGGCINIRSNTKYTDDMRDNTEVGGLNLVIYDADYPSDSPTEKQDTGNHGISACRQKLEAIKNDFGVVFDYYIWPDNQSNGELEDLLIQLIPSPFDPLLECIKSYSDCLKQSGISNIETPSLKEKINTYCYATNHAKTATKRNYKDENFWNLNINEIPDLAAFKKFLDKFLTPPPPHLQK